MPNGDQPVTKKDLDALRDWIAERMEALEEHMRASEERMEKRIEASEQRMIERLEAQETRLLTAFHRFAEANHTRIYKVEVEQRIDGDRLTKLEARVQAIEERLDFPNQPKRP